MTGLVRSFAGKHPRVDPSAFIAETAVVIGDVAIGPGSSVWYGCVLRGDLHRITIGRGSNIQDGTVIHENSDRDGDGGMPTTIGDGVVIGHMALIHACTLGDRAFVGMGAIVMDGAVVEADAMVAAGAMVTPRKIVKSGELWAGRPARLLRTLSNAERAERAYIATHYAELAAAYLAERRD